MFEKQKIIHLENFKEKQHFAGNLYIDTFAQLVTVLSQEIIKDAFRKFCKEDNVYLRDIDMK